MSYIADLKTRFVCYLTDTPFLAKRWVKSRALPPSTYATLPRDTQLQSKGVDPMWRHSRPVVLFRNSFYGTNSPVRVVMRQNCEARETLFGITAEYFTMRVNGPKPDVLVWVRAADGTCRVPELLQREGAPLVMTQELAGMYIASNKLNMHPYLKKARQTCGALLMSTDIKFSLFCMMCTNSDVIFCH